MNKLKILIGLPASGKSTWAKEFCEKNTDWVRVNRDDLRNMRGKYWVPKQENMISDWEYESVVTALSYGLNVILDATNLNEDRRNSFIASLDDHPVQKLDFQVELMHFDVSVEECIKRDAKRANGVGEKVIRGMYDKYLAPAPVVYDEDYNLPHCVIFDIDGTLAENNSGRSPYDWKRVGEDDVKVPIKKLLDMALNWKASDHTPAIEVFVFTGRDGSCHEETIKWLKDNDIFYHQFFMRGEGDTRKDSIVKKELFEEHIRGKYYVDFVVDDRDQVVDMWRKEIGLTCFQVDYGNF